ncbi:MAG: DNA alkylation repair protein [Tannerellaceae bacterium]|nr:DNA alkylation repair protein [Tannerellaceae bacterium]MCD8265380.1 DNA alkylation repair protein [Tannerellaceae bacterium]
MTAKFILSELFSMANPEKAAFLQGFFKTGPGQYAAGDKFLGIVNPITRSIAKANREAPLAEVQLLLQSEYHEARLCALVILTEQFKRTKEVAKRQEIYNLYLANTAYINNWDLVDVTCPHIVGVWLLNNDRSILYQLAASENMWEQRMAIVSTVILIKNQEFEDTFELARCLMNHPHDLMHKAVGWMLREIGKKDREALTGFLEAYTTRMPRTALRYAIEHYPEDQRQYFLKKK